MISMIENFFSEQECNKILQEVLDKNSLWVKCKETEMYILGNSLLREQYYEKGFIKYDKYLKKEQTYLNAQDIFKERLSKKFKEVKFIDDFGKPGFQIIKKNEGKNPSVWHYDDVLKLYPFEHYFYDYKGYFFDYFENYFVFTLMISDGLASFDYYPETESKYTKIYEADIFPICQSHVDLVGDICSNPQCHLKTFHTINYKQGSLLVQEKQRMLHRVGNIDLDGSQNYRITLNSYGVIKNKTLFIFW